MPETLSLPWGSETLSLELPSDWQLLGVMQPNPLPVPADACQEIERSLAEPTGSPRLKDLVKPGAKIALVIDDDSRPTPVRLILPLVLAELERGGAGPDQVTIVPATGVHQPMSEAALAHRVGEKLLSGLRWETHDCDATEKLTLLGTTSRGTPVFVNRTVAGADLVVSIGCIEPHIIASYGGGYKNLVPGVAGRATIAHNHSLNCRPDTFNSVGQPIEPNPMRMDLEEAARLLKPQVFIVNAVLNSRLEVVRVVCGEPVQAHREGARTSSQIYGAKIPRLADIVISSSHPMDQDLRQGVKALANTVQALRPGGVMITCVRAEEGVGVFGLANRKLPVGRKALKLLAPLILLLVPHIKLKGMGEEDRFFLYFALQAMRRGDLLLYAPTIPPETQANLPFVTFVDSFEAGLAYARRKYPQAAEVLVFPHGGSTFPIVPK
ncbi:MAG TPA: nickel-dependent lactate racemase [Anaerolineales bacterium]|nr:nickel-dependent lactate racemase [Anaerolineales bacterium]